MKKFIILTKDGFTSTKNNTHIENLQVLDILDGLDTKDALTRFKNNINIDLQDGFDDIIIFELKSDNPSYFSLNDK